MQQDDRWAVTGLHGEKVVATPRPASRISRNVIDRQSGREPAIQQSERTGSTGTRYNRARDLANHAACFGKRERGLCRMANLRAMWF